MFDANTKQRKEFIREFTRLKNQNRLIAYGCGLVFVGLVISYFI